MKKMLMSQNVPKMDTFCDSVEKNAHSRKTYQKIDTLYATVLKILRNKFYSTFFLVLLVISRNTFLCFLYVSEDSKTHPYEFSKATLFLSGLSPFFEF